MSASVDNVFRGVIPQRVVIGIVDNDALNGTFRKNPFSSQNYKMTLCEFLKHNELIPNRPCWTNCPTEGGGEYVTVLQYLFTDIVGGCHDHGNAISR